MATTAPITIAGITRDCEVQISVDGKRATTMLPVALCRVGRAGAKLHACHVFLWLREDGKWLQDKMGHALNRNGCIVAWNTPELDAHKSKHNSNSNFVKV